jgi:two-component system, NtrC family, response regulator AtoC
MRVGALKPRPVDVRFLSATHRDLGLAVRQGTFRQDLYFRLNGITLRVPPLRERRTEIRSLAQTFADAAARQLGQRSPRITDQALAALEGHPWPGNVRELRNVIDRAVLLAVDGTITPEQMLFDESSADDLGDQAASSPASSDDPERARIIDALARCGGSQTKAATLLGISRRTLTNRLNELKLPRPRK